MVGPDSWDPREKLVAVVGSVVEIDFQDFPRHEESSQQHGDILNPRACFFLDDYRRTGRSCVRHQKVSAKHTGAATVRRF